MTRFQRWHLKNDMLSANLLANLIGVILVKVFLLETEGPIPEEFWQNPLTVYFDAAFDPVAFIFVAAMTLLYERPIRAYLNAKFENTSVPADLRHTARQRLLNEPFVLISLSFSMWLLSAIAYPILYLILDMGSYWMKRSCFLSLSTGLITSTVAFFMLEHVLQKRLASHFFPNGGLYTIPRTMRIRIRTRLAALLFACNLIPLITIILIIHRITDSQTEPAMAIGLLQSSISINVIIFLISGTLLTMLVSRNLTLPFSEIIQTLRGVRNGRFDKKVQVTTNDEIGYTGDVINEMTEGLQERERLQQSLELAKEVQQNLLPNKDPEIEGLDIAGTSIYCEETGGDYYDYLLTAGNGQKKICVVVGDVSDHGIPSALLMTTARAFLRQRTSRSGELDQVVADVNLQLVADVNLQLTRDVEDSGRFMTLFICEVDRDNQVIQWVNAGHDPAMIYDREGGRFEDLTGNALPLGVSEITAYQKFDREIAPGQIIMMGTDGIWEAQNPQGEMFGKERFKDIIRDNAARPAKDIIQAVIKEVVKIHKCECAKVKSDLK
jgi:sigma-B regulation protein RsbU (phosphoserine phosphatase)